MVLLEAGKLPPGRYLSLVHLPALHGVVVTDDEIVMGALTTYSDVMRSRVLQVECPLLCRAASETGGVATQNRGTIGGNIANASPAADTPPALLVYDAERRPHLGSRGAARALRQVPPWLQADGPCAGRADQLGARGARTRLVGPCVAKSGTRRAQAISKVCFAAAMESSGAAVRDIRIAFGSVAPTVVRAAHAEAAIRGRTLNAESIAACCVALDRDLSPIDDLRSTAHYRMRVARNLLEQFLVASS